MTTKPTLLTIFSAYNELDRIAASPVMSAEAREAARRAAEMMCAVRSALDLSWDHSAAHLCRVSYTVKIPQELL